MFLKNLVLLLLLTSSLADNAVKSERTDFKKSLSKDCAKSYSFTCLKLDLVNWVDTLNAEDAVSVYPGVSLVRESSGARANNAEMVAEIAREFPNDPDARVDAFLLKKVSSFFSSRSLKLSLGEETNENEARGGGEGGGGGKGGGGGGKKGGGGMMMVMMMGAMMKGMLGAVALKGIALMAGKAIMVAMMSLLISAAIGLKSLSHGGGHTTYEVISKPVYTHHNSHSSSHEEHGNYGHSSYGRSFDAPLPLGLQKNYKPPQP